MMGCPPALRSTSATVKTIMKVRAPPAMTFKILLTNRRIAKRLSISLLLLLFRCDVLSLELFSSNPLFAESHPGHRIGSIGICSGIVLDFFSDHPSTAHNPQVFPQSSLLNRLHGLLHGVKGESEQSAHAYHAGLKSLNGLHE